MITLRVSPEDVAALLLTNNKLIHFTGYRNSANFVNENREWHPNADTKAKLMEFNDVS